MNTQEKSEADKANKMLYILQKNTLTMEEACLYLGISTSFMYKLTSARLIPFSVPNGKIIYFARLDLDTWAMQNKKKCVEEIEREVQNYLATSRKGASK